MSLRRLVLNTAVLAVASAGFAASAAQAAQVSMCNVPITMSDGTVLRANVFLPNDDGKRYPTILTATGYNKDAGNPTGQACSSGAQAGLATANAEVLDNGYAVMILDDRGTGASQGRWDSWGQRSQDDYSEVLDWMQAQKWSSGKVATNGTSYMGITSLLIAEQDALRVKAGKPRAVQAVWANVPMADAYRDVTFHGGAVDAGFIPLWLGLTSGLSDVPPSTATTEPQDAIPTYAGHLQNQFDFAAQQMLSATTGGDAAYDGPFYRLRSPIERIKSLTIPVAMTGGWWDIFQRGEPLLWEGLTNSKQRKLWMMPQYHGGPDATSWAKQNMGAEQDTELHWFDHWLKGTPNGVDKLPPVNLYTMGAERWKSHSAFPVPGTKYTPYYLSGDASGSSQSLKDGSLTTTKPKDGAGDSAPLMPASSPCSRMTAQWTAGAGAAAAPCETDNRTYEAHSLTYTTAPLKKDTEVTGPVSARVWAELTKPDATLVAVLSDVDPSGKSTQVTAGFLLASQRALDAKKSTRGPNGIVVRPYHPFTRASQQPVPQNDPQSYDIEIYPTSQVFAKDHRIRLTIATANTPTTATPLPDMVNELGGQITLLHGGKYASSLLLPLAGS